MNAVKSRDQKALLTTLGLHLFLLLGLWQSIETLGGGNGVGGNPNLSQGQGGKALRTIKVAFGSNVRQSLQKKRTQSAVQKIQNKNSTRVIPVEEIPQKEYQPVSAPQTLTESRPTPDSEAKTSELLQGAVSNNPVFPGPGKTEGAGGLGGGPAGGLGEGQGIIGAGSLNILFSPAPRYPIRSRVAEEQGTVFVIATVEKNGRVIRVELEETCGFKLLDQSALATLPKWRFDPKSLSRYSSAVRVRIPVRFQLAEE